MYEEQINILKASKVKSGGNGGWGGDILSWGNNTGMAGHGLACSCGCTDAQWGEGRVSCLVISHSGMSEVDLLVGGKDG